MLSTNSLSAFSSATTTTGKARGVDELRLVREPASAETGRAAKSAMPNAMPSVAPPRGSLVNLSV